MNEGLEQTKILREILIWLKIIGMKDVKEVLRIKLSTDAQKLVYHHSDGSFGTKDFKAVAGVSSTGTVSNYWKEWSKAGIVEMINVKGGSRAKKLFNLEHFGVAIPNAPELKEKES